MVASFRRSEDVPELHRKEEKRFYYVKTDARCADSRLGGLLERYFTRSLVPTELESFQQHLEGCLLCSAKVENLENIEAAMEYYNVTPEQAAADPGKATRLMNLTVVDLSGQEMPKVYFRRKRSRPRYPSLLF